MAPLKAQLRVRKGSYRGVDGFHIRGTDGRGRRVMAFCRTEPTARALVECYRNGGDGVDAVLLAEPTDVAS